MAITVVKHGYDNLRVLCPTCGAELSFEHTDIVKTDSETFGYIVCPDCSAEVDVKIPVVTP